MTVNKEIPFHKPYLADEEIEQVVESLRAGWLTMGRKTMSFEDAFSCYLGTGNTVAVSSCTAALHLALMAVGLKEGDEVIVPDITFTATAEVACYFNAVPVIVDVDRDTHNMDVEAVRRAITPRTRAIIPVHYAGQPCDMDEIVEVADAHGLHVIEDAAHSLPAWYKGRKIGTLGDLTCFSFYVTKTLSTGEGGMVATSNDEWASRIRTLRLHGISRDAWNRYSDEGSWFYEVLEPGFKYNMTDLQAALGLAQVSKLEWLWSWRKSIAEKYTEGLGRIPDLVTPPVVKSDRESAWHLYVIKLNTEALTISRAELIEELKGKGISTSVHFIPLHRHPYYRDRFNLEQGCLPVSDWVYERIISLPIYPGMIDEDIDYVIENLVESLKRHRR